MKSILIQLILCFFKSIDFFLTVIHLFCYVAAAEEALPLPRVCPCQNGGLCHESDTDQLECSCPKGFLGDNCETAADKQSVQFNSVVAILGPLALILILSAAAAAFYFRNRPLLVTLFLFLKY